MIVIIAVMLIPEFIPILSRSTCVDANINVSVNMGFVLIVTFMLDLISVFALRYINTVRLHCNNLFMYIRTVILAFHV